MIVVPEHTTPITTTAARDALIEAFPDVDRETAALLLSLIWVESGGGDLQNNNPGNLSASPNFPGRAWRPPWFEVSEDEPSEKLKRLHQLMIEHKAPEAFRAYKSISEGFADFVRLLRRPEYAPLLAAGATGDVPTFRAELARRYSADYTPDHDRALKQFQDLFRPLVSSQPAPATNAGLAVPNGKALLFYLVMKAMGS